MDCDQIDGDAIDGDPTRCNDAIEVPYGPICRTLSILIAALFLGIAFRRFSPRIGNGFSKIRLQSNCDQCKSKTDNQQKRFQSLEQFCLYW